MALAKVIPPKGVINILPRGSYLLFFLAEVGNILYGGSGRMGCHMGTTEYHSASTYWEGSYSGVPPTRSSQASTFTWAPWWSSTSDGASKFQISIEVVDVNIKMVPVLGHLPTEVKITFLRLGSTRGMEALLAPGAFTESACFSSLSCGASSDGPPGKADLHSLVTPSVAATFWPEWTLIQLGYICSSPTPHQLVS